MESQNLQVVVVLMPLQIKRHTITNLKALICGIEHTSGHRRGRTFTLQKVSWKNTHFAS